MRKNIVCRVLFYLTGLVILAFGITLNTKTGLGVSPIISVAFSVSTMLNSNFGDMTFIWYTIFVVVEIILHIIMSKRDPESGKYFVPDVKKAITADILQIPLCLLFTRFMNLFSDVIPELADNLAGTFVGSMPGRIVFLLAAIICTGVGAVMSLDMRLVPNPGDGIVQALGDFFGRDVGFVKNCFDVFCICFTILVGFVFAGHMIGVGIGTVLAVIGVGRVMAAFNYLFLKKMACMAGIENA